MNEVSNWEDKYTDVHFHIREQFKRAHPDIAKKLESKEYSFLKEDEHLGDNLILLGLGGSYAYGLDVHNPEHESDIDVRGVAFNRKEELLGLENFEQFENNATDTVVYGAKKFFSLVSACNPNVVEILGLRNEDYIYISPVGQMILDNREVFLSKRAAHSFGGYANAQLRRIQSGTTRDRLPDNIKNRFIGRSIDNAINNLFNAHNLEEHGSLKASVDEQGKLVVNGEMKDMPLGEFIDLMNVCKQVNSDYEKTQGNRNNKKDDMHLQKHCSHLVRLYRMGIEILRDHEINTYRSEDKDYLLALKNGLYMNNEGVYEDRFYEEINKLEKELEYWKENSSLPASPDYDKIEKLLIQVNEAALDREFLTREERVI